MATRMQQRRGTAAQWTAANPTLAAGEIGFETDTSKFKMGNGSSAWSALTYFTNSAALVALLQGAPEALNSLQELAAAINNDPNFFTNIGESISDNIDLHNVTTNVHGIANTSLLATLDNVSDAKDEAIADAATAAGQALSSHNDLTTGVHGIDNTANLATTSSVSTAISNHNDETENVHGIADTAALATKIYADDAVTDHNSETENVHGIANTALLATTANITTHNEATQNVHGILDTADLATQEYVNTAVGNSTVDQSLLAGVGIDWNTGTDQFDIDSTVATKTYADGAVSTHNLDTTDVHGIADTSLLVTTAGAQTLTDKTLTTPTINGPTITATGQTPTIHGIYLPAPHDIIFEGTTANDFETTLTAGEPTADNTVTLPNASGTLQLRVADVSDTEIGYLNGVTSAIQTQIDAKAPLSAPTFTGTVTSTNDLVVDGNLTVNGTTFNASSTSITIEDNMLQLAHQNAANTVDLGLVVAYNDGTAKHSGLVRDVSDDEWKLFKGVTSEPTTTVNFGQGSLDNLELNNLVAAGIVFTDGTQAKEGVPSRTPIIAKTDSYTLSALTERDSLIEVAKATATTITIPTDATLNFPIGTSLDILQTSTGQVTIAGAGGVTVNATPGLKLRTTWSSATLFKRAANTWVVYGDLTA
jgi:hypothetical protein